MRVNTPPILPLLRREAAEAVAEDFGWRGGEAVNRDHHRGGEAGDQDRHPYFPNRGHGGNPSGPLGWSDGTGEGRGGGLAAARGLPRGDERLLHRGRRRGRPVRRRHQVDAEEGEGRGGGARRPET